MFAATILTLVAVVYRIVLSTATAHEPGWLSNFAPLSAIALCGAVYLPRRIAIALPLIALFLSDLVINAFAGVPLFHHSCLFRYAALGISAAIGILLRARPRLTSLLPASLAGSLAFYLLSTAGVWLGAPEYPQTAAGLWQSLTIGLPGYPPAYLFFRNAVVSDLLFTLLFVACMSLVSARAPRMSKQVATGAVKT